MMIYCIPVKNKKNNNKTIQVNNRYLFPLLQIIAVCDFLNYLKYIERGLVKSSPHDVYWEIARLRKDMVLARLGMNLSSWHY